MAAWRYWRIWITANNGDIYTALQEIQLRATVGGADLTTPSTPTSQSSQLDSGSTAANLVDNYAAPNPQDSAWSTWCTPANAGFPQWVRFDLGSPTTVVELAIWPHNGNRGPLDFLVQGSNDATTWSTEATFAGVTGWALSVAKTFAVGSGVTDTPVAPGAGSLAFTGPPPTVARTANQATAPAAGTLALTGYAPTLAQTAGRQVAPGAGAIAFTGLAPTISASAHQSVAPDAGTLSFTGWPPGVLQPQAVTSGSGSLTLAGHPPAVTQAINQGVSPGGAAIVLAGHTPGIAQSAHRAVEPQSAVLSLAGFAPQVAQTTTTDVAPLAGALSFTGFAPAVQQATASPELFPNSALLALIGWPPELRQGAPVGGAADYSGGTRKRAKQAIKEFARLNELLRRDHIPVAPEQPEPHTTIVPPLRLVLSEDDEDEEALMLLFAA